MARGNTRQFKLVQVGSGSAEITALGKITGLKPEVKFYNTFDAADVQRPNVSMERAGHSTVKISATLVTGNTSNIKVLQDLHTKHKINDPDQTDSTSDFEIIMFTDDKFTTELGRYAMFGCKVGPIEIPDELDRNTDGKALMFEVEIGVANGGWK